MMLTVTSGPKRVEIICPSERSVDKAAAPTTWYRRMLANSPVGSSKSASTTPAGNAANASSVGANTVNGPAPERSSANSAAITAASKVV